jgi:iron complex outermembrane receptor protein
MTKRSENKRAPSAKSGWRSALAGSCALGAISLISGVAAQAQQTATSTGPSDNSGGLEEVIVTAQRRSENVQNVPIAISAFTSETLQSRNLVDIHAIGNLSPGVNLDAGAPFSGDRSVLSASIRGIGQDDFAFNLNPGVGVYVDGVYLARTIGANQQLLDVDRIEILKGPQGTLFGANTIGGAISIVTHTPGEEERFVGSATGGSYDRRDFAFTADLPLISNTLLSTISVSSQNQTGWQKVIPYPSTTPYGQAPFVVDPQNAYPKSGYQTSDNYGGTGVQTVRGKLLWKATDKLNVTFTADWSHEDQTALPYTVLGDYNGNLNSSTFSTLYNLCISNNATTLPGAIAANGGPPPFVVAAGLAPNFGLGCSHPRAQIPGVSIGGAALLGSGYVGGPAGPYNYLNHPGTAYLGTNQPRIWDSYAATNTGNIDTTYANGPDFARNDVFGFSATAVYDLSDTMQLKSISGYRQIKWDIGTDLDGTPETLQEVTDQQHQWQVSQEFQLLGKALDNRLNYVGGLYYLKEHGYVHDFVPFEALLFVDDLANDVTNEDYAAFFHGDFRLNDSWGFTAGGRYTDVKTSFLGGQADLNNFPYFGPGPDNIFRYFPAVPDSQTWHIFDPTAGVQFHFNEDVMSYVSWSKGFKQGGWTTRLSAAIPSPTDARFNPEYSQTYELGMKSEWFQHHLLANAAVYYTDYKGIQLNIQQGISPVYTNAGNAKIKGAELELQYLVGGGLQLNATAAFIDAYYTSVNPNANFPQYALPDGTTVCPAGPPICGVKWVGVTALDAKIPKTPKWKATFDPEYTFRMPNEAQVRLIPAFTYTTEMFNDSLNTPQLRRPATRQLDASIHYVSPSELYDAALGGTNLTNDRYPTAGSPNYGAGEVGAYYNPPRMWYLSLRVKFGK